MSRSIYVALLFTSLGVSSGVAQVVEPLELDPISVEANDEPQLGEGNSVKVDSEKLARQNPSDLQDVFKGEPTIAVGSSIPASQKLYVNGVEETNLLVTIDGGRQNNKIFHHNATTLIDPGLLKAVRVDPGVAPADAGPGALAGSVAYETKDVDDLLAPGRTFGGSLKEEYESNGDIFTTSTSLFGRSGGFEALGFFKIADGGLREGGDGTAIVGSGTHLLSGLGKVAYETDTGNRFELSYERVNDDESRPYRANIGQIIGGRPTPLTRNYNLDRQNFVFTYTDETPQGWWAPKISLAYSATDLLLPEDTQVSFGATDSLNGSIKNRFALGSGSVTAGLDFFSDSAELDYRFLADPNQNADGTEKASNVGAFAQGRLEPSDKTRLSVGVRADFQRFEGLDGSKNSDSGVSGNLSGEYDISDSVTLSAGYSHVWGGVALAENFIMNSAWAYPSGGIEAVTSDNVFIAAKVALGDWGLDGKVFRTEVNDARTPSYGGGPGLTSDLQSQGFELGVGYNWNDSFVRVGYANIDTEVDGRTSDSYTGRYLTTPIGEILTLEVAHSLADRGLTLGADAQIVLEETDTYNPDTGLAGQALPSYEVFNAFVEYKPKRAQNLTLRGEVNNVFDEIFTSRATYGQEFGSVRPLNEPGRSIKLSATMRF